jgi:Fic family protein
MASNRLTLIQVEDIYRTNKIATAFEPTKVDDIIEIKNHFIAMRYIVDNIHTPLTIDFIKQIHYLLTYGTHADIHHQTGVGEFRTQVVKLGKTKTTPPREILFVLTNLLRDYERKKANLEDVLDFHVQLEGIRPFEDYNGRVGRLLMMKECLRYGITPFIIDDKHRSQYLKGVSEWDIDRQRLIDTAIQAQERFESKQSICRMMQYHRTSTD